MKKVDIIPYAALAWLVGGLGIHKFYTGNKSKGIVYMIFWWTGIPAIISIFTLIAALVNSQDGKVYISEEGGIVPQDELTDSNMKKAKTLKQINKNNPLFYQEGSFWALFIPFVIVIPLILFIFFSILTSTSEPGAY